MGNDSYDFGSQSLQGCAEGRHDEKRRTRLFQSEMRSQRDFKVALRDPEALFHGGDGFLER